MNGAMELVMATTFLFFKAISDLFATAEEKPSAVSQFGLHNYIASIVPIIQAYYS